MYVQYTLITLYIHLKCTCTCMFTGHMTYSLKLYMYSTYQMQLKRHTRSTRNVNASVENWYAFVVNLHAFVVKPERVRVRVHACIRVYIARV